MVMSLLDEKLSLSNFKDTCFKIFIMAFSTFLFFPGLLSNLAIAAVTFEGELRTCRDTNELEPYSASWENCLQVSYHRFEESGRKPSVDETAKAINKIWKPAINKDPRLLINTMIKLKSKKSGAPAYTVAEAGTAVADMYPDIYIAVILRTYKDTEKLAPYSEPWEKCLQDTLDNFEARGKKPSIDEMAKAINDNWKPKIEKDPLKLINALTKLKSKKSGGPAYNVGAVNAAVVDIYRDRILVIKESTRNHPAVPPGLKISCESGPDTLQPASTCPVIKWRGYTYWAYSHIDNRFAMTIIAYDAAGNVKKKWYKTGARYLWQITVDPARQTVTLWGQKAEVPFWLFWVQPQGKIVMKWQELQRL